MPKHLSKKYWGVTLAIILSLLAICTVSVFAFIKNRSDTSPATVPQEVSSDGIEKPSISPVELNNSYEGVETAIGGGFIIRVPNGWNASISENPTFLAIMFARPNQLSSLVYSADNSPAIDRKGIPSWDGLTEHFFVIKPTTERAFELSNHLEVVSQAFTFNDGTVGQYHLVTKHEDEARKWGGLQKDTQWHGHTYIYEKAGKRIEAHLALYPSSETPVSFFENVVKTIHF